MPLTHFVVLGGGLVGGFIARQLAGGDNARVTLVDNNQEVLDYNSKLAKMDGKLADLSIPQNIESIVSDADIVVGAVPGWMGYMTAEAVILAEKPYVDISFFPEDARSLDELARGKGVPTIVDCGVMPGFGGMLAMHLSNQLDTPQRISIMVGGLPIERYWPLQYKAPFSPIDVIEEYTRPARLKVNGMIVEQPALSDVEMVDFTGLGTLEAFNTDGLRSLLFTMDVPNMVEKTLRYPGHSQGISMLKDLGFFSTEPVRINGNEVTPLEFSSQVLFKQWELKPGMNEFTVMRVEVEGLNNGRRNVRRCDLYDATNPRTGDFSMARTTGWPAILIARALTHEEFPGLTGLKGVIFPEQLAKNESLFNYIHEGLSMTGIHIRFSDETH